MMVDVTRKEEVYREATATGKIVLRATTLEAIRRGEVRKGDPLTISRVVAMEAVKRTPYDLPFCHSVPVTGIDADVSMEPDGIRVTVTVRAVARTGVEMEALNGVAAALLNVWDMVKSLEKDESGNYPWTRISEIRVVSKVKNPAAGSRSNVI
ncbi:MAG: cyclic pyranopterin monophosphate synthase MoaC [Conexivisphaera sp.]